MKLTAFNRKKYVESLRILKKRKAPGYVIEAYKDGYVSVINEYYRQKLLNRIYKITLNESTINTDILVESVLKEDKAFLTEALTQKDLDFIKVFFKMANLDLISGDRLPPDASNLIKQKMPKNFGLKDLFKKLR